MREIDLNAQSVQFAHHLQTRILIFMQWHRTRGDLKHAKCVDHLARKSNNLVAAVRSILSSPYPKGEHGKPLLGFFRSPVRILMLTAVGAISTGCVGKNDRLDGVYACQNCLTYDNKHDNVEIKILGNHATRSLNVDASSRIEMHVEQVQKTLRLTEPVMFWMGKVESYNQQPVVLATLTDDGQSITFYYPSLEIGKGQSEKFIMQ